jgi:hypothetical protein
MIGEHGDTNLPWTGCHRHLSYAKTFQRTADSDPEMASRTSRGEERQTARVTKQVLAYNDLHSQMSRHDAKTPLSASKEAPVREKRTRILFLPASGTDCP